MGGAMKPSVETLWRMDHPAPDPPRPTWRERHKARKQIRGSKTGSSGSTRAAGKGQG